MSRDARVSGHPMWIIIGWIRTLMVINQTKVSSMESTVRNLPEEGKPLPRFIRIAAALVFPILFELRNDPRVRDTPKVEILFSNPNVSSRSSTEEKEEAVKDAVVENAPKFISTNNELESPSQNKHILKNFYGVHQPFIRSDINQKTCFDITRRKLPQETLKRKETHGSELKFTRDTIIENEGRDYKEIRSKEYEIQDGELKQFSSDDKVPPTVAPKMNNEVLNDRVPLRFQPVHQRLPDSQLSSWSSMTADNSLSDLYCDDELKLSLEFDPNMQLFTTIEEEGDQELVFSNIQRVPEDTFLTMSVNSEDLSYSSFVTTKHNSGSYSIGFPSIVCVDDKGVEDVENHEASNVINSHIIKGRKGAHKLYDMADDDTEDSSSETEESTTDDYSPNQTPLKRKKSIT